MQLVKRFLKQRESCYPSVSVYLVEDGDCPAEDGQRVDGDCVLAGAVGVEDAVLQHEPAPLPLARGEAAARGRGLDAGAEVARHLPALAARRHLQPLRHEPRHGAGDVAPLEPGPQVDIVTVNCELNIL